MGKGQRSCRAIRCTQLTRVSQKGILLLFFGPACLRLARPRSPMRRCHGGQATRVSVFFVLLLSQQNLPLSLEPIVQFGSGLVRSMDVKFVRSLTNPLFER